MKKILKKVNLIKVLIVELYLVIAQLVWHCKEYVLLDLMKVELNTILYYIYVFGLGTILTIILIALIITLKRHNKYKEEEHKNMEDTGLKNLNGETIELVEILKSNEENLFNYVIDPKNLSIEKLRIKKSEIETAYGIRIYYLEPKIPTRYVNIYCTPYDLLTPKLFQVTVADNFLDDFISLLIVGPTGSGKTYFAYQALAKITWNKSFNGKVKAFISDIKNEDFLQFKNCPNYYGINAVDGIKEVHKIFKERMNNGESNDNKDTIILLIEEYGILINSLEKKEAEEVKKMVEDLLFGGRSKKIITIVSLQRADAEYFRKGSREQFKKIALMGTISETQADMLLDEEKKKQIVEINQQGYGYLSEDGKRIMTRFKVAKISQDDKNHIDEIISSKMW